MGFLNSKAFKMFRDVTYDIVTTYLMVNGTPVMKYGAFILHSHLKAYHSTLISRMQSIYKKEKNEHEP